MTTDETTLYKRVKKGSRNVYVPVAKYIPDSGERLSLGVHLQNVTENGWTRRFKVDPALVPFVAAAMILQPKLIDIMQEAEKFRIPTPLVSTPEQKAALDQVEVLFNRRFDTLQRDSIHDVSKNVLQVIQDAAVETLKNDTVRAAYEQFLLVVELTKEKSNDPSK